ncbi:MAG: ABC transporter permease [Clostridiales bacterium]|jgi:putative ABC transport system permease protein|nr:ABC transporter permease [Clostridiales bacterium]
MNLTAKLAYSQIRTNRGRTFWTLAGIVLSTAMVTAVMGFAAIADDMFKGLLGESHYYNSIYNEMLLGLGAIFGSIIFAASVIVITNAFRVSAGERIKQFGILKSVGATKQQITNIILHEGLLLGVIGIPAGIALGLFVNYVGIQIIGHLLAAANARNTFQINMKFIVTPLAVAASVSLSLITILASAWIPARKAAKIAAIDAIRGTGEVKIKSRQVRGGRFIGKLFGFEGMLAYKSMKRNRRNFRATVLSLTVSVVLFIIAGEFGAQYMNTADLYYMGTDANVVSTFFYPKENTLQGENKYHLVDSALADEITQSLREHPDTSVFGVGDDYDSYHAVVPSNMLTPKSVDYLVSNDYAPQDGGYTLPITLYATDAEHYAALCKLSGVPVGSNILINYMRTPGDDERTIFEPYSFDYQTLRLINQYDKSEYDLPLHGELSLRDVPGEITTIYVGNVTILVPQLGAVRYTWFAETSDTSGYTEHANKTLGGLIPFEESQEYINATINTEGSIYARRDIGRLIMVFIYGFVALLTLIGLTNVISTISANMRSRAREFAVLRSVGMTPAGLRRMVNLDSLICSMKALAFGIPIGIIGSCFRFYSVILPVEASYQIPWFSIFQCIFGVFAVTWVAMRYGVSRLRSEHIIETIRSELV